MEIIKTSVKNFTSSNIINALRELQASPIAIMGAPALGDETGHQRLEILARVGSTHTKIVTIELVCYDEYVEGVKDTIAEKGGVV
ncbi:hypothetical protein GTN66_00045 [bacterium]|nr:hypothetical protein [bacterium]NIN91412.1 hypothetical protein [bacterium]NIO17822.1 hypothetical protein [bacterium]NIO72803.1 hypothetical protein [bacterium]